MFESIKNAREDFFNVILPDWLDPLFFGTAGLAIFLLFNVQRYEGWDNIPEDERFIMKMLLGTTVLGLAGCLLRLFGVI